MAKRNLADKISRLGREQTEQGIETPTPPRPSRSLEIARKGLNTGYQTIHLLTATITDVLEETITTNQANVVVNAVGKVLKTVELQFKYGKPRPGGGAGSDRDLVLGDPRGGGSDRDLVLTGGAAAALDA